MREMLANAVQHKRLPFRVLLRDTWYAAKEDMLFMERLGRIYYCPIKENHLVSPFLSRGDSYKNYVTIPLMFFIGDDGLIRCIM